MARAAARSKPPKVTFEYESLDIPPRYVEGVQGVVTAKGAVQIYFFSDFVTPPPRLEPTVRIGDADTEGDVAVDMKLDDPYGLKNANIRVTRRIEANLILPVTALRELHAWSGQLIQQLEKQARKRGNPA